MGPPERAGQHRQHLYRIHPRGGYALGTKLHHRDREVLLKLAARRRQHLLELGGATVMSKRVVGLTGVAAYSVASAAPLITTMKATEVLVLPALDPGESYVEPAFVLVETAAGDDGGTITAIDLIQSGAADGRDGWTVRTLGQAVPLSHAAACEWAVSYAASRNIPIVYERNETIDENTKRASYAAALSAGAGGSVGAAASSAAK